MEKQIKILVCGYGFVGMAHALAFESEDIKVHVYDPAKGYDEWPKEFDAAIIAVSTPEADDGSCDMNNVYNCIEKIPENIPILIKSTISLDGWKLIKRAYPWRAITFSPEFLRANHALEDFKNQKIVYLGGFDVSFWINLISNRMKVIVEVAEPEELILAKYFRNSFLATKVTFFNQVYDLCEKAGVEYSAVANYVTEDPRIGDSHSFVNPDDRGFGGHCFPKDTRALVMTGRQFGKTLTVLEEVLKYNNSLKVDKKIIE